MIYRVKLYKKGEINIPYEIGGITADNKHTAIDEAKNIIVDQGYWYPWEDNTKQRYKRLKVEWVETEIENK